MLLADCTDAGALRGYARIAPDAEIAPDATARQLLGSGYLAFTVDQGMDREPQQGIVALEGETLAEMAEYYYHHTFDDLRSFHYTILYNPKGMFNHFARARNPHPWIRIKNN